MKSAVQRRSLIYLAAGVGLLAAALLLFYLLLRPPLGDFGVMTLLMSVTTLLSALAAFIAYRTGWIRRSPTLRWTLMGGYALAGLLVFFNVWLIARMMFASQHDLLLATVLLFFASGIAMLVGFFLSQTVTDRAAELNRAAQAVAGGDLTARAPEDGSDEMARLGRTFNEMAARLQEAQARQQAADLLRRDLIAWVGHDLRTPLTSIRAILEALADHVVEDPATVRRYHETAQKDIRSLSALIDDLFEMAQVDAGGLRLEPAECSLSDLVSDTLERFSHLAQERDLTLRGEVAAGVDPVWMDAARVERVLANLTVNALRHTPPGGFVEINASQDGGLVRVEVRDSGPGIAAADLPHVFEQFYRGEKSRSRETGGAGLGLAISKGIIAAHGGEMGVESLPGQGARFHFTIPVKASKFI